MNKEDIELLKDFKKAFGNQFKIIDVNGKEVKE